MIFETIFKKIINHFCTVSLIFEMYFRYKRQIKRKGLKIYDSYNNKTND